MKKLLFIVALLTSTINFAQNQGFNYKALITQNGNVLNTQSVNFRFTLLENGTTAVYQETQNATTDNNGIVSINVGEGTVVSGDFSTIDWGNNSYFLKVEVDTGNGYQDFGTSELKYVPYAKYAEKAGNTFSGNYDDLTNKPDFTGWDTNASDDFSGNFNDLTNVPAGLSDGDDDTHLSDSDIATMGYIKNPDDADHDATNELQNLSLNGNQLSISNGNNVSFNGWDTDASDDFSGNYNDLTNIPVIRDTISAVLDTTSRFVRVENQGLGDVLAISNNANGVILKNLGNPVDDQDAVTKSYLYNYTHASDDHLVLWNKLGSENEVLNSEVGENGILVGNGHNYEPAKFGNGYVRTDINSYVKFPASVLEARREKGTIEFWVVPKVSKPRPFHYGAFMLVGYGINCSNALAFVRWGDGVTGRGISGGVNFDGTIHKTPDEAQQFEATVGVPFHIALVWDVNGIDGTSETIRLYRDGVVIGTSSDTWNANATNSYDHFFIGTGPDDEAFNKYIMDNIKVWDYAKTDFSDINDENLSQSLYTAGEGIEINNNVISIKKHYVGEYWGGGIVFWVDETGEHGLICAKENQNNGNRITWQAGTNTNTMAKGNGVYAGKSNTILIIASQGYGNGNLYAARLCNELIITENGINYGDWYLPSIDELNLMYQNKNIIDTTAANHGGSPLNGLYYWSSTEYNQGNANWYNMRDGYPAGGRFKSDIAYVRAVRSF